MTPDATPMADPATPPLSPMDVLESVQSLFAWHPARMPLSDPGHLPLLHWLTRQIRPKLGLCLGVGDGGHYFTLCEAVRAQTGPAQIFGIDIWTGADGAPLPGVPDDLAEYAQGHYPGLARLVCANPGHAAEIFDLGNIDLLVVDQPLSADLLEHLVQAWVPLMSARSAIVLRGTTPPEGALDHGAQLDALRARWPHLAVLQGSGVLVLLTGSTPPASLAFLCQTDTDAPLREQALGVLHWLGAALADRQARSTAMAEITQLKGTRASVGQERDLLRQRLDVLQQDLARQTDQLASRDATIASLTRDAEAQAAKLTTLEAQLAEQQRALQSLTGQAETLRMEKDARAQEHRAAQATCETLQGQLAQARTDADTARQQMEAMHARQTDQLASRDATIASLTRDAEAQAAKLTALEARNSEMTDDLTVLTRHAETLHEQMQKVEKQARDLEVEAARRVRELKERLETAVTQRDDAREKLVAKRLEAETRVTELKERLETAVTQRDEARATLKSLKDAVQAKEKDLSRLKLLSMEKTHELAALRNSTSWRVTAPLRGARTLLTLPKQLR